MLCVKSFLFLVSHYCCLCIIDLNSNNLSVCVTEYTRCTLSIVEMFLQSVQSCIAVMPLAARH